MTLTPREYQVARLFALGRTWDDIAVELHISKSTLLRHRANLREKADVASMQEVLIALGWLRVPDMRASASDATNSTLVPEDRGSRVVRGFGQALPRPGALNLEGAA